LYNDQYKSLLDKVNVAEVVGLPRILALVWMDQSPEFQIKHDIFTLNGRNAFLQWWKSSGYTGYYFASNLLSESERNTICRTSAHFSVGDAAQMCWMETSIGLRISSGLIDLPVEASSESDLAKDLIAKLSNLKNLESGSYDYLWHNQIAELLLPCSWLEHNGFLCVNLSLLVWHSRPDLVSTFDLRLSVGREGFSHWWQEHGPNEYSELLESLRCYLETEIPGSENNSSKVILTNGSILFAKNYIALNEKYGIDEKITAEFVMWLLCSERNYLDDFVRRFNVRGGTNFLKSNKENANEILRDAVYQLRKNLDLNFTSSESRDYHNWWSDYGKAQYTREIEKLDQLFSYWTLEENRYRYLFCSKASSLTPRPLIYNDVDFQSRDQGTVNIIGIPGATLGISEDFRQILCAVKSAGYIPRPIYQPVFPISGQVAVCDAFPAHKGAVNIFVQPAFLTAGMMSKFGIKNLFNARNIACWQWEFSNVPRLFSSFPNVIDEVWAISSFVANGFAETFSVPVPVLPQVVDVSFKNRHYRSYFGLEESRKYFLVAFDGSSTLARKNPIAAIRAFKCAFPAHDKNVSLIVKTYNLNQKNGISELLEEIGSDPRIILINRQFSTDEMRSLIACSDYYVSLHRAEGFGRIIAEAMLLGKPVVVSNYSGNLDYCKDDNSLLVDGKLVHPRAGNYLLCDVPEYYQWFEASIDDAVDKMRFCYTQDHASSKRVDAARKTIKEQYNQEMLQKFLLERLTQF